MKFSRRGCLKAICGGFALSAARSAKLLAVTAGTPSKAEPSKLAMPGPYRGRVVAVRNPAVLESGQYQAEAVRQMMRLGMKELVGADDWVGAWRGFFEPGDVVGIKVNPVGQPHVISDATVVREIIAAWILPVSSGRISSSTTVTGNNSSRRASTSGCRRASA